MIDLSKSTDRELAELKRLIVYEIFNRDVAGTLMMARRWHEAELPGDEGTVETLIPT